jgi:hypothetical protein
MAEQEKTVRITVAGAQERDGGKGTARVSRKALNEMAFARVEIRVSVPESMEEEYKILPSR